jgi:hypothetical protein
LRSGTDAAVIGGLAAALDLWRGDGGMGRHAARDLARAGSGSEAMIAFGLERMLRSHDAGALHHWLAEARVEAARALAAVHPGGEAPGADALSGPPVIAQVLAGNVAGLALPAVMEGLLARSAVVLKQASGDPVTPPLIKEALDRAAPELGQAVRVEWWRGGEAAGEEGLRGRETEEPRGREVEPRGRQVGDAHGREAEDRLLSSVDYVVATGGDAMMAALAGRVAVPHVFYGPRFSIGVVGMEWMNAPAAWWEAVAREIVLWEQRGCLSPRILFVAGSPRRFAQHLAEALALWETRWPAPRPDAGIAAAVHGFRVPYEMADGARAGSLDPGSTAWTVVWDEDPTMDAGPPARVVRVTRRLGVREFGDLLLANRDRVQGMGTAFLASKEAGWKRAAGWSDIPWIADLTAIQDPPAGWRADGRSGLGNLLSWKAP